MASPREHVRRVSWLVVPIVAYLVITLALPILNGAARRADFPRHASIVLGACVVAVAITVMFNALIDGLRRHS